MIFEKISIFNVYIYKISFIKDIFLILSVKILLLTNSTLPNMILKIEFRFEWFLPSLLNFENWGHLTYQTFDIFFFNLRPKLKKWPPRFVKSTTRNILKSHSDRLDLTPKTSLSWNMTPNTYIGKSEKINFFDRECMLYGISFS